MQLNELPYLLRETDEEYHSRSKSGEVISSHMLSTFRWSPAKYKLKVDGLLPEPPSPALEFGRAAHKMILEGRDAFDDEYTVCDGPINDRTGKPYGRETKAYQDWRAQQIGEVITETDFATIEGMAESIHRHPVASNLLQGIMAETVVRTEYVGALCQIKMDGFNPDVGIIDLKTTGDIGGFYYDIGRPGYDYQYQAAFYRAVLQQASKIKHHFWFIAVEKTFPYTVGVWYMSQEVLDQAQELNERKIRELIQCRQDNTWPTGYEEERTYDKMLY